MESLTLRRESALVIYDWCNRVDRDALRAICDPVEELA